MTFNELYLSVKKKFDKHPELLLEREKLAVQVTDVFDNAFFILWDNQKCSVEPFHYHDCNVCITGSQRDIELLFTERQYLFLAHKEINIQGSFQDVMAFQELLCYITKDNSYVVQEEIISKMLLKQDMLKEDLGIIMQSLQLLLTNSLVTLPDYQLVDSVQDSTKNEGVLITEEKTKRTAKKKEDTDDGYKNASSVQNEKTPVSVPKAKRNTKKANSNAQTQKSASTKTENEEKAKRSRTRKKV